MSGARSPSRRRRRGLRRLFLPALILVAIYFCFLVYPPMRVAWLIWPAWEPGTPILLVLIVVPIMGRLAYEWWPGAWARRVAALSMTWLGMAFILFCVVLPWELLNLLLPLPGQTSGLALAAIAGTLCLGAAVNAQLLTVRELKLPAPGLDRPWRLVQISDVHIGSREPALLRRIVAKVRTLEADAVLITGDLIDFRDIQREDIGSLAELSVPVWYCIGNHERYVDLEAICERLRSLGVRVLRDEVDLSVPPFVVAGIDDADSRRRVADGLAAIGPLPEGFRVLLYHRPDGLEEAAEAGVDLMLCGHTHNGQIVPFNFLVRRVFPRIKGLYEMARGDGGRTRLYVSTGTGTWGPLLRLGSRNEITLICLQPPEH
ncbi:MAG: metallophosphoesterase [Gammaproteobacteria bacterium]|nr:metallophosphoesterase [Gammaproteobacteria bacterium]